VNDWPKEKGTYIPISSSAPADCPNCARLQAVAEAAQRWRAASRQGTGHQEWCSAWTALAAAVDALGGAPEVRS
jgi:hypothetical protein